MDHGLSDQEKVEYLKELKENNEAFEGVLISLEQIENKTETKTENKLETKNKNATPSKKKGGSK